MKITDFFCMKVEKDNEEEDINYTINRIIKIIRKDKVILEDLQELQELSDHKKQLFLSKLEKEISNEDLHELNKKIMEYAKNLSDSKDFAFLLRSAEKVIFRKLIYLEAINNNFKVDIDEEKNITFNLPANILELLQILTVSFYRENFKNVEFQKSIYQEFYSEAKTLFEELNNDFKVELEKKYIKKSLAKNIMWLLITKYIEDNYEISDIIEKVKFLHSLNIKDHCKDSNYINELQEKNIIYLIGYPKYDEILVGDEIKLSGNEENNNMTFEIL